MLRQLICPVLLGTTLLTFGTPSATAQSWEFEVTPYAWMAGLQGDLGTVPGYPSQPVDLSFGQIAEDLDYAFMLFASARSDPWVVFFDSTIVKTTSGEDVGGDLVNSVEIESKTSTLALAVGRTVAVGPAHRIDLYAGARAWWLENDYEVDTVLGKGNRSEDASWVDPLVGAGGNYRASEDWNLFGSAEIGGFGVGADIEWTLMAGATYAINERFGVTFAWRHQVVDYNDDGIVYDVTQTGPLLGATFRF